ncbi:MAG: hypothetical protein G01um101424_356, partial [Parcubacteria group bacterium Gr01-1014_24]
FVKNEDNFDLEQFVNFLNEDFNDNMKIPLYTWEEVAEQYHKIIA